MERASCGRQLSGVDNEWEIVLGERALLLSCAVNEDDAHDSLW